MVQYWVVYGYTKKLARNGSYRPCSMGGLWLGLITTLPQQAYTTLVHTYSRQKGIENNVMVCHGIGVILKRREDNGRQTEGDNQLRADWHYD